MEQVKLLGTNCRLEFGRYSNKTIAIQAYKEAGGEPFLTVTINYEQMFQGKNYCKECAFPVVVIKNYSENEGIYDELKQQGVILVGPYLSGSAGTVQIGILTEKWKEIARKKLRIKSKS